MFSSILQKITSNLNDNLKLRFNLNRDLVRIQAIDSEDNEGYIGVSILNIERDTSAGISFQKREVSLDFSSRSNPNWQINFYILIAAVFPKKKYAESLKLLDEILRTIQANHVLVFEEFGLRYSVEPMNLSFAELSNIWSICGGAYQPSIVCKIRSIEIDGGSIIQFDPSVKNREIEL